MIERPAGLDLRRSLRSMLGEGDLTAVEMAAVRQERTIDAMTNYDGRQFCLPTKSV